VTARLEAHRVTGTTKLAAQCDTRDCDQSAYADGTDGLRRIGWALGSITIGRPVVFARCPEHAQEGP